MKAIINSDFSYLESSSCYCSEQSADIMRALVKDIELNSIHYIGTGDYHYCSLFYLERIEEDFCLVLIDNHSDDQKGLFDLLSCGSWVQDARSLPHCKKDIWIKTVIAREDTTVAIPIYLSIDLDVLSPQYAHTNWSQGTMTLNELCEILQYLKDNYRIIGVDICGGLAESKGGTKEDQEINNQTINSIITLLHYQSSHHQECTKQQIDQR